MKAIAIVFAAVISATSWEIHAAGVAAPYWKSGSRNPLVTPSGQTNYFSFGLQNCCEPAVYFRAGIIADATNYARLVNESVNPDTNYFLPPQTFNVPVPVEVFLPPSTTAGVYCLRFEFFARPEGGMFGSAFELGVPVVNITPTIRNAQATTNGFTFQVEGLTANDFYPPPAYTVLTSLDLNSTNWTRTFTNFGSFYYTNTDASASQMFYRVAKTP